MQKGPDGSVGAKEGVEQGEKGMGAAKTPGSTSSTSNTKLHLSFSPVDAAQQQSARPNPIPTSNSANDFATGRYVCAWVGACVLHELTQSLKLHT